MSFVSFTFAAFFLVVLAARVLLDRPRLHETWIAFLLVSSLVFYAWSEPWHVLLLLAMAAAGYVGGRAVGERPAWAPGPRASVAIAVAFGLGTLGLFKYFDYLASSLASLAALARAGATSPRSLQLALPLGISFYTFEMISYVVDIRRGRIAATRRFDRLLFFLAFFPHLVAGPIVRAGDFLPQIDRRRRLNLRVVSEGVALVARGLFLKVVVADNLAAIVNTSWPRAAQPGASRWLALVAVVAFAFQILCDFDGYSTIARGTAYLLGFRLPVNFDSPYVAGTFREFWQRWHITLSRWLRDYLYVPLGGNRVGHRRLYANLLIVMTLGGLWHGAADTFVLWGAIHGAALAIERALGLHRLDERGPVVVRVLWWVVVQATVLAAWTFFRSPSVETGTAILQNLVWGSDQALPRWVSIGRLLCLLAVPIVEHLATVVRAQSSIARPGPLRQAAWTAVLVYVSCTAYARTTTFIYFQF